MVNPGSMIGAFTDELGELGKQIVRETVKVPKDIAGKALESLGASSGQKSQQQTGSVTDARAALAQLAGIKPKQKEPSVWEKIQAEAREKKELSKQQQQQAATQQLPVVKSKRPRGDLYGLKAKKASGEVGKNVRQD
ncbi:hypothetical protein HY339_02860 [Candidatus Gottesmanbacteria bacterium]|nr:hypothetical protein [Candidatus Gottesmanbacteria bacterium]